MSQSPEVDLAALVRLASERSLTVEEAEAAFTEVMEGNASDVQIAALLVGIRSRGAVAAEVAGGVRALRRAMVPVEPLSDEILIDTCGTGGGGDHDLQYLHRRRTGGGGGRGAGGQAWQPQFYLALR